MKYNDNGTYKDIYVKTFDTLPVGTEVDYDGNSVPDGWTEVDEVESGTLELYDATKVDGTIYYNKIGRIVQLTGSLVIKNGNSSAWTSFTIANLPNNLSPLSLTVITAARDTDGKLVGIGVSHTSKTLYISDRGRQTLSTSVNSIPFNIIYISAE